MIVTQGTLEDLIALLRCCGTKGDPGLCPYAEANISIESLNISDLVPLAKYVLQEQVDFASTLDTKLIAVGVNIFTLPALVEWDEGKGKMFIAPPVVEFWEGEGFLLVDGLHRVWLARQRGMEKVTCVVIRGATSPLVPMPTTWDDIKMYGPGEMPDAKEKRVFRFADADSLKIAMPSIMEKVTNDNFQYFLYRELSSLGSSGVRARKDNDK